MAEDGTWARQTLQHRGRLIRFAFRDPDVLNAAGAVLRFDAGPFVNAGGNAYFGHNLNANHHPEPADMRLFRHYVYASFRNYIDPLGVTFKASVSDEAIGALGGNSPDLSVRQAFDFYTSAPPLEDFANQDISRETGADESQYKRDLETKAIIEPDQYIRDRNADLKRIEDKAVEVFKLSFQKYYNDYKMTSEEAKKQAMQDKDEYYKILKRQHDLVYKIGTYNEATKHVVKST